MFSPSGGFIDDKVFEKMREVLFSDRDFALSEQRCKDLAQRSPSCGFGS